MAASAEAVKARCDVTMLAGHDPNVSIGLSPTDAYRFLPSAVCNQLVSLEAIPHETRLGFQPVDNKWAQFNAGLMNTLECKMAASVARVDARMVTMAKNLEGSVRSLQARVDKTEAQMALNTTRVKDVTVRMDRLERKHGAVIINADRCTLTYAKRCVANVCWDLAITCDEPRFKNNSIKVPLHSDTGLNTFVKAQSKIRKLFGKKAYVKKDMVPCDEARSRGFDVIKRRLVEQGRAWSRQFHSDGDKVYCAKSLVALWVDDSPEVISEWR